MMGEIAAGAEQCVLDGTKLTSERCAGRQDEVVYTSLTLMYAGLNFYAESIKFSFSPTVPLIKTILVGYPIG